MEIVSEIRNIESLLRGAYTPEKYQDVVIPMIIIRRFECVLTETKEEVCKAYENDRTLPAKRLFEISKQKFYNTSKFTLKELLNDPDNIAINFEEYIEAFSKNVQDIMKYLDFFEQIKKLERNNKILNIVKVFSELPLEPQVVDNQQMGDIFEFIIHRYSGNSEAGDHYTPRELIRLLANILLAEGS